MASLGAAATRLRDQLIPRNVERGQISPSPLNVMERGTWSFHVVQCRRQQHSEALGLARVSCQWEPAAAERCIGAMDRRARSLCAAVAASLLISLLGGCASTQTAHVKTSPSVPIHTFVGGCAGTVLTDAEPPVWAQAGWSVTGPPWPVPWAFGTQNTTIAFVFSRVLVAGSGPRVDGTYNKVTWVAKDRPAGVAADYPFGTSEIGVEARPLGESQPVLTNARGASVADLPKPGCWTFRLSWSAHGQQQVSTIDLEVLPAGARVQCGGWLSCPSATA